MWKPVHSRPWAIQERIVGCQIARQIDEPAAAKLLRRHECRHFDHPGERPDTGEGFV